MTETNFDIDAAHRQSYSLGLSIGLHAAILFLMLFNFSWATDDFDKNPPAILMVDLSKVELGDKTNLPPEVKKKDTPKPAVQPKKEEPKKETPKPASKTPPVKQEAIPPKPEPVKPQEKKAPKDAVKVKEPPKEKVKEEPKKQVKEKPKKQEKPVPKKQTPKKPTPKPATPKKTTQTNGLQSLLASVEKVRKPANPAPAAETQSSPETGLEVNAGIKGGTGGSRMEALTISEKDLIANKIRECWNVNAGVEGAEEMIIEIKAKVNRDGRIQDVRVINMKNDPVFRSMADSAVRAIHICDNKGSESPFKMLADKRPEHYSTWKEIHLRMNPVDGGVF